VWIGAMGGVDAHPSRAVIVSFIAWVGRI